MAKKKKSKFEKKYGFPPNDIWAINYWLSGELSKRLLAWADGNVMSYKPDGTAEEWEEQIRTAGEALKKYHDEDNPFDKEVRDNAQDAMQWVADNWHDLWD